MPKHKIHRLIDRIFLSKEFPSVHAWMDEPYRWLGPRHRILRHSVFEVFVKYHRDPEKLTSALLHILADRAESLAKRRRRKSKP